MNDDETNIEHISYEVEVEEVISWRVINNMALGSITHVVNGDEDEVLACIQLDTSDVDGSGKLPVTFGLNPGAVESFVGSLCMNMAEDEEVAKLWYEQIWDILHSRD